MSRENLNTIIICFLTVLVLMSSCAKATPTFPPDVLMPTSVTATEKSMAPTAIVEATVTDELEKEPEIQMLVPAARRYHSFCYNSTHQKIIMIGGQSEYSGNIEMLGHDNTWAYDPISNSWSWLNPPLEPPKIFGSQLAYDIESDLVIFYGGGNGRGINANGIGETWAYDFYKNLWIQKSEGPKNYFGARIVYDSESDKIILFGGSDWQFHLESSSENENFSKMKPGSMISTMMPG